MHGWPELQWQDAPGSDRLEAILQKWKGTPYREGSSQPGGGTDCVRFVTSVISEMHREPTRSLPRVRSDQSLHAPEAARAAMRELMRVYDARTVQGPLVRPGDILAVGPAGGGPGHAVIVGCQNGSFWECMNGHGVREWSGGVCKGCEVFYSVVEVAGRENW